MIEKLTTWTLVLLIVLLYGVAGALDNPDSELGHFLDNLTSSN
jgi:hypothetical protein